MHNIKARLIIMAILLVLFLPIYFTFYTVDRNVILKEARSFEWTESKVGVLYILSDSGRMHCVTYEDRDGKIHKDRRCSIEIGKVIWKERMI